MHNEGVVIKRGPRAGEYFDYVDHPRPGAMEREADLAPKKKALTRLAANLEHDGGPKTDFLLFTLQCCDSRTCDVVRGNRFQAMHRALRLLIKQADVNVASPEFSCMIVGIFGIANLDDFEVYVDQIEKLNKAKFTFRPEHCLFSSLPTMNVVEGAVQAPCAPCESAGARS